ncbi:MULTISPECIES: alanine/glycine:cation symporter family protein [Prauserella salsuginis group]|uniref:AGCS family alanine or glycine:cation symporter n=2 Tax=Prauserella salsuginis group TaxID=2893672 RepID=A0A839XNY6_9PSEU|nr:MULTISPECIES: alanine/glycine:cation symporter family protein [Prauserella salsuginis group]MBB3663619.1 AGCS family alanine or glycine:cation symporter [Prauserella sediminis]MCR3722599.1 alanine or glycine:cation symporter, AGCS family [Prauserella flava]MCR3737041.1 alanine or glycine:cation symporter, AGCS family [Prauserella salsuginis]
MELLTQVNEWLWTPLVVVALGFGLLLTFLTRCMQIRLLPTMVRQLVRSEQRQSDEGISPFQALSLAMSSRVGVGNIAGVATAIAAGGPGALFWMAMMTFLGGATAFVESTLAQIFKRRIDGQFRGGMPYYIEKGLGLRKVAVGAAVVAAVLYAVLAPGIQSNAISSSFDSALGIDPLISAIVITVALAFIIVGGRKRIVKFVQVIVPFMAGAYILAAVVVLAFNVTALPSAVGLVLSSAFGAHSVYGGILGAAIAWGVRRALFSNVAGVGEGTYSAAAAQVSHPAKQGLVQCLSVYIDTLFVCMATGLMIIVTGAYNVEPAEGPALASNLPGTEAGPAYTQAAMDSVSAGAGGPFVAVALALFAFSTLVAFYYISETNLAYVLRRTPLAATAVLKTALLAMTFWGAVQSADLIWAIGDIGYASLAWVNMLCLLLLAKPALRALRDFDAQRRRGLDPTFVPASIGLGDLDCWQSDAGRSSTTHSTS